MTVLRCHKASWQGFRPSQNQANARLNLENLSLKSAPNQPGKRLDPPQTANAQIGPASIFMGLHYRCFCCQLAPNAVVATCYPLLPILFTLHILPPGDAIILVKAIFSCLKLLYAHCIHYLPNNQSVRDKPTYRFGPRIPRSDKNADKSKFRRKLGR